MRKFRMFLSGQRIFPVFLGLLFLLSFCLPLVFAGSLLRFISGSESAQAGEDEIFPDVSAVSPGGSWIRVPGSAEFSPQADKDFLMIGWFKSRVMPDDGERMLLLSGVEKAGLLTQGFGLGLLADQEGIRPQVFWADSRGRGGWKTFLPVEFVPHRWFMFAISFYRGRQLGLHWARLDPGRKIKARLAGGYDFAEAVIPRNEADITIGSRGKHGFRGKIGPVLILKPARLHDRLPQVLREVIKSPGKLPSSVQDGEVVLWVRGGQIEIPEGSRSVKARSKSMKAQVRGKQAESQGP